MVDMISSVNRGRTTAVRRDHLRRETDENQTPAQIDQLLRRRRLRHDEEQQGIHNIFNQTPAQQSSIGSNFLNQFLPC